VELPRWTLDASISKKFGKMTLRFTAENILDYPYEFEREDVTTRKYRRGRTFGMGIAFSF
jgi:outer membrane receptor protein involved in Fe transport